MKALKEKRLSLRSCLRRGLVILSLFALAFAFASCGDSSSTPTDPGDPGNPTNPPVTPAVYAQAITVSALPSGNSFQGMPPVLDGMILQVLWSDSKLEWVEAKDFVTKGFYAVPPYCDIATEDTPSPFVIAHNLSTTVSGEFDVPAVIPLTSLHVNIKGGSLDWYADAGVDPTKFELQGFYKWGETAGIYDQAKTGAAADKSASKIIPVSVGYPKFDLTNVPTDNRVEVTVGNKSGATKTSTEKFSITNYYVVQSVEFDFANVPAGFYAFDDDLDLLNINSSSKAQAAMLKKLSDTKPSFKITYDDNKTFRTIGWSEFYSNVANALVRIGSSSAPLAIHPEYLFLGDVGDDTDSYDVNGKVLYVNENNDDAAWVFYMQYVPKKYDSGSSLSTGDLPSTTATYTSIFPVSIPVYAFEGSIAVEKKPGRNSNVVLGWATAPLTTVSDDVLDAINDNWTLTASYARKGVKKNQTLDFTSKMFTDPRGSVSGVSLIGAGAAGISGKLGGTITSGQVFFETNWALPLIYRGEIATEDETVQVDLTYKNP